MKNDMKFRTEKPRYVRKYASGKGVKLPENSKLLGAKEIMVYRIKI